MRLNGWEDRLASIIEDARIRKYQLGTWDCFRLSCSVVQALTGRDLWTPWAGSYTTKREALRRIREFSSDFTSAASKLFDTPPEPMAFARRGDVCEFMDAEGEQHLGIVLGVNVALLGPEGLTFLPREACRHFWRIGNA